MRAVSSQVDIGEVTCLLKPEEKDKISMEEIELITRGGKKKK
jgi:hypothetical protein